MIRRIVRLFLCVLFLSHCSGGDKHFPSSNPPEYDPTKNYSVIQPTSPRGEIPSAPKEPSHLEQPLIGPQPTSTDSVTIRARELVRRILSGGQDGQAAVNEAVTAAGFAILDSHRRVVAGIPAKPEMGLPLEDWEARILARSANAQITTPFEEFQTNLAQALGEQDGQMIVRLLREEIKSGVHDSSPTVRMWATLLVELGRQLSPSYDLVTDTSSKKVHLNGLQQVLMLKHVAAEFFAMGIRRVTEQPVSRLETPPRRIHSPWLRPVVDADTVRADRPTPPGVKPSTYDPCAGFGTDEGTKRSEAASGWGWALKFAFGPLRNLAGSAELIGTYRTLSETTDLRSVYHQLSLIRDYKQIDAEIDQAIKTLSKVHNIATAVLSLAELTVVLHAVRIDIDMTPPPALERTKNREPGKHAELTAKLSFDMSDLDPRKQQTVRCASSWFMAVGLDFSIPESGPIKGADVEWSLVEGGLKMDSKAGYHITEGIVELENSGPRIQDAGVAFGDVRRSVRSDAMGVAKTGIHGAPQKRPLPPHPQPVIKKATVRANVQLKPADIFRDLADALKGPWALPAQVLYRSHLLGKNYTFDVKDWTPGLILEFKSHIVQGAINLGTNLSGNGFDAHVQATIPLHHTDDRGWVGEGTMQYETLPTTQPARCEFAIQGSGTTTFHVNGGLISSDPEPFAVTLIILPGQTGEVADIHCSSANTPEKLKELFATQGVHGGEAHSVMKSGGWSGAFNVTRFTTFNTGKGGYEITGWTPVGDSVVIAKKTIRVSCSFSPIQPCQEETELILRRGDVPDSGASPQK